MSKITSKLQVTIPKILADKYGVQPGDDIQFEEAGEIIRVLPPHALDTNGGLGLDARLRLFDAASNRQRHRRRATSSASDDERSWTRAELYRRGASSTG